MDWSYHEDNNNDHGYPDEEEVVQLVPCGQCGRNFNQEALKRHGKVCASLQKKRKPFDIKKQRLIPEAVKAIKAENKNTQGDSRTKAPKKADWRRKHEEFVNTIRQSRGVTKAIQDGTALPPPPPPAENPDYITCQYCTRRFNVTAGERHIEFCKQQADRLPGKNKQDPAKLKMKSRTKYKPPLPGSKKKNSDVVDSPVKPRGSEAPSEGGGTSTGIGLMDKHPNALQRGKNTSTENIASNKKQIVQPRQYAAANRKASSESGNGSAGRCGSLSNGQDRKGSGNSGTNTPEKKKKDGDPKWFEELTSPKVVKQAQLAKINNLKKQMDDLELEYPTSPVNSNRVGVIRPSSRHNNPSSEYTPSAYENRLAQPSKSNLSDANSTRSNSGRRRMANFCHDCGTKYPVVSAKFCCECGSKRAVLEEA